MELRAWLRLCADHRHVARLSKHGAVVPQLPGTRWRDPMPRSNPEGEQARKPQVAQSLRFPLPGLLKGPGVPGEHPGLGLQSLPLLAGVRLVHER